MTYVQPNLFEPVVEGRGAAAAVFKKKKTTTQQYTVISMFSGCGGMDLGFQGGFSIFGQSYRRLPFHIAWANDINQAACRTYRRNLGNHIHPGSVWDLVDSLPKATDVLIGGFPCQDISVNGKGAGVNGKRSSLYLAMVEAIERTKPKIFVAENVKGLLMRNNKESLTRVLEDFRDLEYEVSFRLYHTADYGVPQSRERVIIVGTRPGVKPFVPPKPTQEKHITAKQALVDLEAVAEQESINHVWSRANRSSEQGNRKLQADRPGYTIRAECHGNIQYHYSLPRRISMREAARIQSFPDDFIFDAKLRETERQIGNAVPPVFAWHIANAVLRCLK
jgi:DNA (cytosine-5)-methyltransferase 1